MSRSKPVAKKAGWMAATLMEKSNALCMRVLVVKLASRTAGSISRFHG